jgi:hypothetical protein
MSAKNLAKGMAKRDAEALAKNAALRSGVQPGEKALKTMLGKVTKLVSKEKTPKIADQAEAARVATAATVEKLSAEEAQRAAARTAHLEERAAGHRRRKLEEKAAMRTQEVEGTVLPPSGKVLTTPPPSPASVVERLPASEEALVESFKVQKAVPSFARTRALMRKGWTGAKIAGGAALTGSILHSGAQQVYEGIENPKSSTKRLLNRIPGVGPTREDKALALEQKAAAETSIAGRREQFKSRLYPQVQAAAQRSSLNVDMLKHDWEPGEEAAESLRSKQALLSLAPPELRRQVLAGMTRRSPTYTEALLPATDRGRESLELRTQPPMELPPEMVPE